MDARMSVRGAARLSRPRRRPANVPVMTPRWSALVGTVVLAAAGAAAAQQENPVYVDDSPRAWELFQLAQDQAKNNAGEAVRLYQELLDDYAMKLLPISELIDDHFFAVRARVLAELAADPQLLQRFRLAATAEAQRLLESGQLRRLAITRSLTEPGLEALLRLAQEDLERGWFHSARDWLEQAARHPDLDGRSAAHCWYMYGVTAHYLDRPGEVEAAARALADLGAEARDLQAQLDRLVAGGVPHGPDVGRSTLDCTEAVDLDQLVGQPIWSMSLRDTPLGLYVSDAMAGDQASLRHIEMMRRSGALLTTAPTVAASTIYVNEGGSVHAVDRFTGRPLWPAYHERSLPPSMDQGSRTIADLNIVAVRGGTLVTISGHAYADATKSERTVVCMDAQTGFLRWAARIDQLSGSDELEGLFPYGAPIIGDGQVYVAARKVSRQLLTSCYVMSLDLSDGHLVWARHVASSGGIRTRLARPFSNLLYDDGDLAVATAIGAVARIDATTGQTRWLRRYNPPLSPFLAERRPWEMAGPVMTAQGLVALRPDHRRIILLDWDGGDELLSVNATGSDAWNSPQYLLARDGQVLGVGHEIRAFRADALEAPVWSYPAGASDGAGGFGASAGDADIRGRVQLVEHGVVVPTADGFALLDDESGRTIHRVDAGSGGNPLAVGPQLIMAAGDRLAAYMPLDRAEQMLRQQITLAPMDPGPALALMRLGVRVRDLNLALEAAEMVIAVLNDSDHPRAAVRQELFEVLLELDRQRIPETIEQGEALHAMIGLVAQEPIQRVEHLLAYGDWLADHALGRAIETYQMILSTPALAQAGREDDGLIRPASTWAAQRIAGQIEARGRGVYGPQAEFARTRLERAGQVQRVDPRELVALAAEFPFSESAVEAAREAAVIFAANGQLRRGASILLGLYRLDPSQARAASLLGLLAGLCEEAGWLDATRSILAYIVHTYGDAKVVGQTVDRDAAAWLAALRAADMYHAPVVGDIGNVAERLSGTIVPAAASAAAVAQPDRVLLYDPPQLAMIHDPGAEPDWVTVLGILGEPSVLRFDGESIVLWVSAPGDDPQIIALDPVDGSHRWMTSLFGELSGRRVPGPVQAAAEVMPGGKPLDPTEVLPLAGRALVFVRRSGHVVALDPDDGRKVIWQRQDVPVLDQVHLAAMSDSAVVLAGTSRSPKTGEPVGRVVALDPATGETLYEIAPRQGAPVRWMEIGPLGLLTFGNAAGIETFDMHTGESCWALVGQDAAGTPRGWVVGGLLIAESPTNRPGDVSNPLRAIRLLDGEATDPFDAPDRGEWDRLDLRDVVVDQGRIFGHYGGRVVLFDESGAVLGADVVSDQRDYEWLLPTEDRILVVSRFKSEPVPRATRRQTEYTYRLYALSSNCKLIGESFQLPVLTERLEEAAVIDGWLLVSTGSETIAVSSSAP